VTITIFSPEALPDINTITVRHRSKKMYLFLFILKRSLVYPEIGRFIDGETDLRGINVGNIFKGNGSPWSFTGDYPGGGGRRRYFKKTQNR
jgi:hypothetical protein